MRDVIARARAGRRAMEDLQIRIEAWGEEEAKRMEALHRLAAAAGDQRTKERRILSGGALVLSVDGDDESERV